MIPITLENFAGAGFSLVISTKAEGRMEKSGRAGMTRQMRGQMSRLRCASLDMTKGGPPHEN